MPKNELLKLGRGIHTTCGFSEEYCTSSCGRSQEDDTLCCGHLSLCLANGNLSCAGPHCFAFGTVIGRQAEARRPCDGDSPYRPRSVLWQESGYGCVRWNQHMACAHGGGRVQRYSRHKDGLRQVSPGASSGRADSELSSSHASARRSLHKILPMQSPAHVTSSVSNPAFDQMFFGCMSILPRQSSIQPKFTCPNSLAESSENRVIPAAIRPMKSALLPNPAYIFRRAEPKISFEEDQNHLVKCDRPCL